MKGLPWYRRYPGDFLQSTMMLTLEQKGAYSVCLDLMYERGGPIPDDPRWLARMCGCSMQLWRKLRERLLELGKLHLTDDGRLVNGRATYEMHRTEERIHSHPGRPKAQKQPDRQTETSEKPARKLPTKSQETSGYFDDDPNEINDLNSRSGRENSETQTPESSLRSDSIPSLRSGIRARGRHHRAEETWTGEQRHVIETWNAMAERTGLPSARVQTDQRRAKLNQQLRQFGVSGILNAIERIGRSRFCLGDNDKGWRADFDFLLQTKSLARAIEGFYDDRPKRTNGDARHQASGSIFRGLA